MKRRTVMRVVSVGLLPLSGCIVGNSESDTGSRRKTNGSSQSDTTQKTECSDMHNSVLRISRTTTDPKDRYDPIEFENLTESEKDLLSNVIKKGEVIMCETPLAFHQFVDRVKEHVEKQDGEMRVYLHRDQMYYGIYAEEKDEVYSY
jgi:hypothetical protein